MAVYPDAERLKVEGEGKMEALGQVTSARPDEAEVNRVSTRRVVKKDNLVTKGVNRPPNSTNRTQKTILSPTKPNVHSPLKTVLNTTRKYTERQQDIHQPQIRIE